MEKESKEVFDRDFLFLYKAGLESIGFAAEGLTVVKSAADVSEHGKKDFAEHLLNQYHSRRAAGCERRDKPMDLVSVCSSLRNEASHPDTFRLERGRFVQGKEKQ